MEAACKEISPQKHEARVVQEINDMTDWFKGGLYEILENKQFESPLEKLFYLAVLDEFLFNRKLKVVLNLQQKIGKYRVDFILNLLDQSGEILSSVIVECDGHEFHEKTKKQAAKDKARDRYLQSQGYPVLRFTGSEIWKDPRKCALEAINIVHRKYHGTDLYTEEELV